MYISLDDLIFFHPDLYRLSFDDYGTVTQTPIPVIEDKRTFLLRYTGTSLPVKVSCVLNRSRDDMSSVGYRKYLTNCDTCPELRPNGFDYNSR